jgi:hypothetical protein
VNHVIIVQIIDRLKHLSNSLRCIFFSESSLLADTIKKFSSSGQLRDNVIFVLVSINNIPLLIGTAHLTRDSNQSTNLTICGCFIRCSISSSSYTICSLPFTFFLSIILIATFPVGPSASLTIPYVPAPRVLPNRYLDLLACQHVPIHNIERHTSYRSSLVGREAC